MKTLKTLQIVAATAFCLVLFKPASAGLVLFGIQEDGAIAERLPFGPVSITESDSAFLNTLVGNELHTRWVQRGVTGNGETLYEITWEFSQAKTVSRRFQDAVDSGEDVVWTITSPTLTSPQSLTGIWRFSSGAGDLSSKFDGSSGDRFVSGTPGNGIWGAGTLVDGTNGPIFPGSIAGWQWGFGNLNGSDAFTPFANSGTLILGGTLQADLPSDFKNLMYVETSAVPEPSSSAILFLAAATLGFQRNRRQSRPRRSTFSS